MASASPDDIAETTIQDDVQKEVQKTIDYIIDRIEVQKTIDNLANHITHLIEEKLSGKAEDIKDTTVEDIKEPIKDTTAEPVKEPIVQPHVKECVICLEPLGKENITFTPCIHGYHTSCINQWIDEKVKLQHRRIPCPTCKVDISSLLPYRDRSLLYDGDDGTIPLPRLSDVVAGRTSRLNNDDSKILDYYEGDDSDNLDETVPLDAHDELEAHDPDLAHAVQRSLDVLESSIRIPPQLVFGGASVLPRGVLLEDFVGMRAMRRRVPEEPVLPRTSPFILPVEEQPIMVELPGARGNTGLYAIEARLRRNTEAKEQDITVGQFKQQTRPQTTQPEQPRVQTAEQVPRLGELGRFGEYLSLYPHVIRSQPSVANMSHLDRRIAYLEQKIARSLEMEQEATHIQGDDAHTTPIPNERESHTAPDDVDILQACSNLESLLERDDLSEAEF